MSESVKQNWQEALSNLITDPTILLDTLALGPEWLPGAMLAAKLFPLKVTPQFVARIEKGNPHDPLLKQILPLDIELNDAVGYVADPLQEEKVNPIPGLLHKYRGRVLITLTSACAIHCRYCFRRSFPYAENNPGRKGWEKILTYINKDKTINEVILSGGDPLSASDHLLKLFSDQLNLIPHVKLLRIHTRLPIVLPERVTENLLNWMNQLQQKLIVVVHTNHAQEIDANVYDALCKLKNKSAQLLNQTVLLKGVNDNVQTLIKLSESLINANVLPYYLHVLDKVNGTAHFDIPREEAIALHRQMRQQLPGYLVPRLVCEEPGALSKTPLG